MTSNNDPVADARIRSPRMPDITEVHPAFYVSEKGEVHTTGVYVTATDDTNIRTQLRKEIANIEGEKPEDLIIYENVTCWKVGVPGRFTPIGTIYVLAMLDPHRSE